MALHGSTICCRNPHAHLCKLAARQLADGLHAVAAVAQVQAQHIAQQRAPPLPRLAAQLLQAGEEEEGGRAVCGESVAAIVL